MRPAEAVALLLARLLALTVSANKYDFSVAARGCDHGISLAGGGGVERKGGGFGGYCITQPPSTLSVWPVTKPLPSAAKNSIAFAMSSGAPRRLTDWCSSTKRS